MVAQCTSGTNSKDEPKGHSGVVVGVQDFLLAVSVAAAKSAGSAAESDVGKDDAVAVVAIAAVVFAEINIVGGVCCTPFVIVAAFAAFELNVVDDQRVDLVWVSAVEQSA